jgi:hypothetical protein
LRTILILLVDFKYLGEYFTMKPIPPPQVPGKTEFERFDNAVRQVLTVPKDEILRREQREQDRKEREEKRRPKR